MPHTHSVLLIDDHDESREALDELLSLDGLRVRSANHGREGLAVLRAGFTPCVILLDLRMPDIDGATFRAEQRREKGLAAIPVVLISGDAYLAERALELGIRDALPKPIDADALRVLIDARCGKGDPPVTARTA